MVSFKINCPSCKQKVSISVKENDLGTRYKTSCPSCVSALVLNLPAATKLKNRNASDEDTKTKIVLCSSDSTSYCLISEENVFASQQKFKLNQPYLSFGRMGTTTNSDLELITQDRSISRKHCIFRQYSNGITIEDVSKGGTLINNHKLEPKSEVYLQEGDELRMGQTKFKFIVEGDLTN